jgi:SAM-dependent methyltransferase
MESDNLEFANMSGDRVHDKVMEVAMPYLHQDSSQILIAGSGQGSLEYKLLRKGIRATNIHAVDINPAQYKLQTVNVQYCDLNGSLPFTPQTFDVCFAVEVIEHLYNPRNLIDEVWRVLKTDGMLFLTTPNVHSIMQKIRFLFSDKFAWFSEQDYLGSGHIHPIFDWLLERMVRNRFELINYTSQAFHFRVIPHLPAIPVPYEHRLFAVNNIYAYRKVDGTA